MWMVGVDVRKNARMMTVIRTTIKTTITTTDRPLYHPILPTTYFAIIDSLVLILPAGQVPVEQCTKVVV